MSALSPAELDRLIHALLDSVISPDEHRLLQESLGSDEEARQRYLSLAELHNLLELQAKQMPATGHSDIIPINKLVRRQQSRTAKRALLAAAAAMIVLGIFMRLVLVPSSEPSVIARSTPYSEFSITHTGTEAEQTAPNTLIPGSSLHLAQGTVELTFECGVHAILQAPASITFTDESRLLIREGRAWFRVPGKAVGFEVTTPQLQVLDLGTEFGIVSDRSRPAGAGDQIHVLKGRVEAKALHGLKRHETLAAGQARAVHLTGRLERIPPSRNSFLTALPLSLPHLHWTFDTPAKGSFPTTGNQPLAEEIEATITGPDVVRVPGKYGMALSFSSSPQAGYLRTTWPGIDSNRPRTISCWIKCSEHSPVGAIVEWGIPLINSAKWRVNLNPGVKKNGGVRGALRTEFGYGYVTGTTDLRDGRWHHITSIYDGSGIGSEKSIRLYVDGRPEPISASQTNEIDTILHDARSTPCLIGARFHGLIDDLRIYQGVLPQEAIGELLESTPPE